ncbi:MAG TPA: glutamine synthetase [Cyanobacteria bacterium UBA11149]|nr:glutamine synthetase [Cyanobacteria bacterium UBA11367]HBE58927.1 glutamine synthetase [Cyanobacteria bacterium UBA11366]HBK65814.1 glutamine synthetase [Cyanobacteria bacterium UBA11166]HBR76689.1 glutamine synthetase [Cyanobacteria bacterium UBA11159]HBS72228.1 glutamine synthetase [Cyanobacteria bacterium UBA11153]HBW90141.1 glutamine synthetase [Cyanobacteria bacterium UBA11149]HCA94342.1 glutamine synthetase [Cyanobacteria bacterium UBA9226]
MDKKLRENLDNLGIRFVRILWCDNANMIRGKAVHRSCLSEYFTHGVGISAAQPAIPIIYDAPAPGSGLGPVGEIRLIPDWHTFTPLPYTKGHGRVIGDMVLNGIPWSFCPRHFLKRMVADAQSEGLDIIAAFENEFYLLRKTAGGIIPVDETGFASSMGIDINHQVIDEMVEALIQQGMPVEQYYSESGPGQQEISILYTDALGAADQQIAFRETIRAIALQHNLIASFMPKIFPDKAGSGCHLHLSLWHEGENLIPNLDQNGTLSEVARRFIAGILHHLPALMALTTPTTNSYRRIRPHCWSGAFRCWGMDNREAAIRIPSHPQPPSPTNFELKTIDATANPYLALGAVIAAGMDGVRHCFELQSPVTVDPGTLTENERLARGIERLPQTLGESIEHLSCDSLLLDAMGSDLAQTYLAVRKAEWEAMKDFNLDAEVKLLLEQY